MCSQVSRRSATDPSITASGAPVTLTDAMPSAVVLPIDVTVTPADSYAFFTASTLDGSTSMTMASSSANSAAIASLVGLGKVTSTPTSGCGNAISRTAVANPPSETS